MSRYEDLKKKYGIVGDATGNNVIPQRSSGSSKISDEKKKRADEIIGHATDKIQPSPIYDYTGASRKKGSAKQTADPDIEYDSSSVLKLGAGPLSNSAVTAGVASGALELTSQNKDGKYSVAKNKDYVAPKKTAQIIDRSPARKAELEAIKKPTQAQIEELAIIKNELAEREKIAKQKEKQQEIKKQYSIAAENEKSLEEAIDGMSPFWKGITRAVWGDSMYGGGSEKTTAGTQIPNDQTAQMSYSIASAAENTAASMINFAGVLTDLAMKGAQNKIAVDTAINAEQRGENFDEVLSKRMDMNKAANEGKKQAFSDIVDSMMQHSEELHQEAYRIAGDEGKFLVDLLYTGTQMAGDAAMNFILPGSGLGFMSMRVFGQSAYEARVNGADSMTQLMFGLKSAFIEYLTEKIGGGAFKKVYGVGIVDDAIESALGRLFKTDTGRTVIRYIINAVNEGNEEVLSDILNPVADRLLGLDEGEGALFTDEDLGQMWYDWMLGTALGGIGGTVNLVSGSNAEQNASLRLTEAAQRALIESGLESETSTDSYKLAEKYQKTLDSGRLLSNSQVQKLTAANDMAIRSEIALQSATDAVRAAVPERAAQMFAERGEQASPELISGVTKLVGEGMPTEAEIQAIEQSNNAPEVARQLAQEYAQQEAASEEIQEAASVDGFAGTWDPDNIVESMFPDEVKSGILSKSEVAEFQGYYDDSGRTIDLNELEYVLRGYINNKYKRLNKEANKNGGNNDLDGSMGREPGKSSGKQDGTVRSGTGEDKETHGSGENRADAGRERVRGNAQKSSDRKVSSRELGLDVGTDERNLTVIPRKDWSVTSRRIADAFASAANGFEIVRESPQIINMDGKILKISGAKTGEGKVIVSASHWLYSAEQLMLHECGHLYINGNLALLNKLRNAAAESMGVAKINELTASYALIWKGLYNDDKKFEMAANGELTGDELKEFMRKYVEELMCDALAGIDRHRANGASKLSEAVRNAFLLETGIDIQALLDEDNAKGSTEVRTEDGKAAKEQPRNNSPPKYSIEYDANNTPFVVVDRDILSGVPENQWVKTVKDNLQKKFPDGITVGKNEINIDYQSRKEMTFSKYMQWLYTKDPQLRADKLRATDNADEILHATTGWINEGLKHPRKDNIIDFARGEVLLRVGKNDYTADVVVGMRKSGSMIMYDVLNLHPTSLAEKETSTAIAENPSPGTNRNTVPISEDSILVPKENVNSYSVDDNLEYELYEVYNGTFDSSKNEVHIGTASNFMTDVIGAEELDLFMPAEKAYRAMKTEHQAIFEGKPYGGNINYHGLGVDGLMDILKASENPIAAYAAAPGERGKRENRIVLVTDVNADGGLGVVIEEVDTKARVNGNKIRANKAITVYPKGNVASAIQEAIADNRILYLDEKRSQTPLAVRKGSNYPTAARKADFANNIRSFWENVKWKKSGKAEFTAESTSEELPEWKKKLAEFGKDSYSVDDALLIEGEDNYNKILRKVREQARRQSVTKLKAEISKLDAKIIGYEETLNRPEQMEIIGYEETVNRTEQMERELQDLLNRRKVYNKVLDKKEKKRLAEPKRLSIDRLEAEISILNERIASYEGIKNLSNRKKNELQEMRDRLSRYNKVLKSKKAKRQKDMEANEVAKADAKETSQKITKVQGRNRSKQVLRDTIFRDFNIESGRSDVGDTINAFADKYADQGRISRKDLDSLFDALMERGVFVAEAEDYARELRAHLAGSSVRVPSWVKEEFGDDWQSFYRRAWGNKIYLKVDSGTNGIDTWTMELADAFGEGIFDTTADLKTQLERIVELAEQGRDEKMNLFQMADYVRRREGRDTADAIVDELYQKLETAVKTYASNAKLEMELTYKNAFQQAKDRAIRQEKARRAQERKDLSERQQRTLKQLQILKGMRDTTSKEFREEIDRVLEGIDTIAVSAANAMNYSKKYEATWESIADMYEEARANDPNFLEDTYIEKHLLPRIKGKHLADMEPADLEQLYQAAVALRTKIYNTRNIIGSETNMLYSEAYDSIKGEMRSASKPKNRYGAKWKAMRYALNPNHYLEALVGWNPDSVWFKTFAQGLENGERKMKRYMETSKQMLDEFVRTHKKWLETADGQGKDGIWYEVKVSPVAEWHKGDQPIFGEPVTVYMTPLQKVHMYLESKNYDNLSHMLGGRVFADKELYSKGNKKEAFAADPIHLAPADVRRISSDLTEEEMELANILERYYNTYAKGEINKVSNELYGFDRAMAGNYAPIFTKDTYNTFTPAIIDGTAEGVGHMKTRIKGARTPTVNISALDAFNKHVSQTSRFVGMAIPLHNMNAMLNWTQNGKKMQSVIEQEWSNEDLKYIRDLITELQNPHFADEDYIEKRIDKIQSAYIGSVFGFNPSVALKVFGSFGLASAELGFENAGKAFTKVNPELIRKYTSEYDVRVRGYASPEVARLVNSQSKVEKLIQSNKFTKELFGGGMMIHTDAIVARAIWAWSEAAVRKENPDLEVGTQEQIDAGQSPLYKAVAEKFNTAIGNTQSMYDTMHRSKMLRGEGAITRAFTMFHTDIMQAANLLIKAKGEHDYYRKALAADPDNKALQAKAAKYEHAVIRAAGGAVTSSMLVALVSVLNSLLKRRDDFYDENNKFMWDKFGEDYIIYVLKDFTGMIPIFDVAFGGLVDHLRGEKWYDVEVMGLSLFNDLVDKGIKVATKIIDGTATIEDYKKFAFLVAKRFGLPFDNVERYMLGLFSWVAPEIGEAYNNMISPPGKSDLKGKSGEVLDRDIYDMYKQFGLDRETTDEIARLYEAGYDKIIMGSIPDSITIDGVEYAIDGEAAEKYKHSRAEVLSLLSDVISSNGYQEADDETRNDMLKRLNSFAYETAKAAAVPEYDMAQWAESCQDLLEMGEEIEAIALMPYTEKKSSSGSAEDNDPRYVKLIKAGVEYNNARDIEEKLTTLVPERGAKSVTQTQKVAAIAYMTIPEDEKIAAIKLIYGTTGAKSFEKYKTATSAGLSSADYADFLTTLDRINDNSGVSQDEFKQAVRESGMPDYVAEQLWATYGWKKTYSRN